jgi:hypothetical protein
MALIDINRYDLLDFLPASFLEEDAQEDYVFKYTSAYADFIIFQIGEKLTEDQHQQLQNLLEDPLLEPDDVEDFFHDKIENFDEFIMGQGVCFKKLFLLNVYEEMIRLTKESNDETTKNWETIKQEAEADDWNGVVDMVKEVEDNDHMKIMEQKDIINPPSLSPSV